VGVKAPHLIRGNVVAENKEICDNKWCITGKTMEYYRKSSHATYRCEYHFVWVPKYRYKVLTEEIKPELRKVLSGLCDWLGIVILEGSICQDHVHMYLSVPPKYSPSYVMKILKGKSAERLRKEFLVLKKKYWGLHIWSRGYFVSTVGLNGEIIRKYIKSQEEEQEKEEQIRIWKDL